MARPWWQLKFVFLLAAVVFTAAAIQGQAAAGNTYRGKVTISARAEAAVDSQRIFLGQVAHIDGGDGLELRRFSGLYLCAAPALGESKWIDSRLVIRRLKMQGINPGTYILNFQRPVKVVRRYQMADPGKIRSAVKNFVRRNLSGRGVKIQIRSIQVPRVIKLPRGKVTLAVEKPPHLQLKGRVPLQVTVTVNGKPVRQVRAVADIRLFARAVVLTRPLGRRQPITNDLIAVRQVEVTRCDQNFFTRTEQVLAKRSRTALPVDTILVPSMLEAVPVVHRGDVVKMIAESGGLRITTQGICREEGAPGQKIRVTNARSRKDVFAEVVDSATVRVSF